MIKIHSLSSGAPLKLRPLSLHKTLCVLQLCAVVFALACASTYVHAQKTNNGARGQRLPAPEKIVGDYLKATGGKKRLMAIRDTTYEWTSAPAEDGNSGWEVRQKAPASARMDSTSESGKTSAAANARSAWMRDASGLSRTLTGTEAGAAKLQAALSANHLIDYKKLNILARTTALDRTLNEPSYVVEFSTREGARLRYYFSAASKLLLKISDDARHTETSFSDYRAEGNGTLEPHRLQIAVKDNAPRSFTLQTARYNTNIADAVFDPPTAEALDIPALLREVEKNQEKIDQRVADYSYTEKRTEREINDRGEETKTTVKIVEIVRLQGGGEFSRLISENGVPLSPERAAKQDKQIQEQVAKYEEAREKREQKKLEAEKNGTAKKKKDDDDDLKVADFVRICEFVSPRRERFQDREAIVFDVRPRPGFRPANRTESIVAKLNGVAWIDPADKEIMRFEARFAEGIKVGGGLLASIRPGATFTFEQARVSTDGVWLPRFSQANVSARVLLFKGFNVNVTQEFSDYRRSKTEFKDYNITAPTGDTAPSQKPKD